MKKNSFMHRNWIERCTSKVYMPNNNLFKSQGSNLKKSDCQIKYLVALATLIWPDVSAPQGGLSKSEFS